MIRLQTFKWTASLRICGICHVLNCHSAVANCWNLKKHISRISFGIHYAWAHSHCQPYNHTANTEVFTIHWHQHFTNIERILPTHVHSLHTHTSIRAYAIVACKLFDFSRCVCVSWWMWMKFHLHILYVYIRITKLSERRALESHIHTHIARIQIGRALFTYRLDINYKAYRIVYMEIICCPVRWLYIFDSPSFPLSHFPYTVYACFHGNSKCIYTIDSYRRTTVLNYFDSYGEIYLRWVWPVYLAPPVSTD